jgi:hypothetical protein
MLPQCSLHIGSRGHHHAVHQYQPSIIRSIQTITHQAPTCHPHATMACSTAATAAHTCSSHCIIHRRIHGSTLCIGTSVRTGAATAAYINTSTAARSAVSAAVRTQHPPQYARSIHRSTHAAAPAPSRCLHALQHPCSSVCVSTTGRSTGQMHTARYSQQQQLLVPLSHTTALPPTALCSCPPRPRARQGYLGFPPKYPWCAARNGTPLLCPQVC